MARVRCITILLILSSAGRRASNRESYFAPSFGATVRAAASRNTGRVSDASAVRSGAALAVKSLSDAVEIGKEWRDAMKFRRIVVLQIHLDLNSNNSVMNSLYDCHRELQKCSK